MGEFVNNYLSRWENYLSRWELDPDDAHDVALRAQPLLGLYGIEKSRGSESVTVRFFRFTVPYGRMEGSIKFSLEELVKAEADPEYGADLLDTIGGSSHDSPASRDDPLSKPCACPSGVGARG